MGVVTFFCCAKCKQAVDIHKCVGAGEPIGYNRYEPNWENLVFLIDFESLEQLRKFMIKHDACYSKDDTHWFTSLDCGDLPWELESGWIVNTWKYGEGNKVIRYTHKPGKREDL